MNEGGKKEIYTYQAPWTVYSQSWSTRIDQRFRLAVGSFLEDYTNKVEVIQLNEDTGSFVSRGIKKQKLFNFYKLIFKYFRVI